MHADWLKMYYQKDVAKDPPWEGSSQESIPVLAEACNQFHARAYPALFPSRNIIRAIPTGNVTAADKERASRVSMHMSHQLMVRDRTYKRNKDRMLLSVPLHGSAFTKTYYDPIKKRVVVDNVRSTDLIVPYGSGPRDLSDIDRKTHRIYKSVNTTKILAELGYFLEEAEAYDFRKQTTLSDEAHDEAHGTYPSGYQNEGEYAMLYESHCLLDLDGDDIREPYIVTVDAESEKVLRISLRYDTDEAGDPTNDKFPIEYFTHYPYLENPDGFYALGLGHLVGKINSAVNKLVRQTVDAGTLANAGNMSGFISEQLSGIQGGELQLQLGKFTKVPGSAEDIAKGIVPMKFPGPQPALMDIVSLLLMRSDRLATVTEALTGQTEKVMQPTTIMALIEQGMQVFSTVFERLINSWEDELQKVYRLNYKFMDPKEYFSVQDVTGKWEDYAVSREDYAPDFQVIPVADPKQVTQQQKLAKAEAEWQFLAQNPLVLQSPTHLYNASRRYLKAIESESIDEVLPDPAGMMAPRVDDPYQENKLVLSPVPIMPGVYPDQDHVAHLQAHAELLTDPDYGPHISELGLQKLNDHMKGHMMMAYGEQENGEGGLGGLAAPPGNGMGAEGPGETLPGELGGGEVIPGGSPNGGAQGVPGVPEDGSDLV